MTDIYRESNAETWPWDPPPPPSLARAPRGGRGLIGAGIVILSVLAGVGVGHAVWQPNSASSSLPSGGSSGSPGQFGGRFGTPASPSQGAAVSSVAAKVDPGLVDINTSLRFQGAAAAGTGMVLTPTGEVLTNNHVIEGATQIRVTDVGNGRTYSASVVGYDVTSDIAVLQLGGATGLQTIRLGDSAAVRVGDQVVGIGNAGGQGGTPSAAPGAVTGLDQSITASDDFGGGAERLVGLIRTDAAIEPGDSGGPLANSSAQVVGVDTAASSGFSFSAGNAGFAIPINSALSIARQISSGRESATVHIGETAFLGVAVRGSGQAGAGGLGLAPSSGSGSTAAGAVVVQVPPNSPAAGVGLAAGDVVVSVNGSSVATPADLTAALGVHHPGDRVVVGWTDPSGLQHHATVQLGSGPPQ